MGPVAAEAAAMLAHDSAVLAQFDPIGMGPDLDQPADGACRHRRLGHLPDGQVAQSGWRRAFARAMHWSSSQAFSLFVLRIPQRGVNRRSRILLSWFRPSPSRSPRPECKPPAPPGSGRTSAGSGDCRHAPCRRRSPQRRHIVVVDAAGTLKKAGERLVMGVDHHLLALASL